MKEKQKDKKIIFKNLWIPAFVDITITAGCGGVIPAKAGIHKKIVILLMFLFITSCTNKPQSFKVIKTIKEDIKQTSIKAETLDQEYKQLTIKKPECKNKTITTTIEEIKSDILDLSNKISITEYLIQTETKICQQEIKAVKTSNILLKVLLAIAVGLTIIIIKTKK